MSTAGNFLGSPEPEYLMAQQLKACSAIAGLDCGYSLVNPSKPSAYLAPLPFKFSRTVDLHFDSPLWSLALKDPELVDTIAVVSR